jgi:nicotinate-nucleotide adenylyltransferase
MKKVGIYSGSFDPVHVGHIGFALKARDQLDLDVVVFIPEETPRSHDQLAPFADRLAMLSIATQAHTSLMVDTLSDKQFTIARSLPEVGRHYPDAKLFMLMGSDVVGTLSGRWPGLTELLEHVEFIVGLRNSDTPAMVAEKMIEITRATKTPVAFHVVDVPHATVAATTIRMGSHEVSDIDPLVADYIRAHDLYI